MSDAERLSNLEAELARERARIAAVERAIVDLVAEGPYIDGDREDPKAYAYWIGQRETLALVYAAIAARESTPIRELVAEAERQYRTPVRDDAALDAYYRSLAEEAMRHLTREETVLIRPSDWGAIVAAASALRVDDPELPLVESVRRALFANDAAWRCTKPARPRACDSRDTE